MCSGHCWTAPSARAVTSLCNYEELRGGDEADRQDAQQAVAEVISDPATPEDVDNASTADLNGDGFVTTDEIVAMGKAGLSNQEMIDRLQATGQVFALNAKQKYDLTEAGVSPEVVAAMDNINRDKREQLLEEHDDVISRNPQG
jgi:esterase/lipase superfamily enzyme